MKEYGKQVLFNPIFTKNAYSMKTGLIALLLFLTINTGFSQNFDYRVLKSLNSNEHPAWDKGMQTLSQSVFVISPLSVLGIWSKGYIENDEIMKRNGYKAAISIGVSALLTSGLKLLVDRPRPYVTYPNDIIQRTKSGPYSFPSGHTSLAFATATAITLSSKNIYLAIPSYAYAAFVGYSRMRLGVHYPSDVLGGMIIGIGSGILTWQLDRMINGR